MKKLFTLYALFLLSTGCGISIFSDIGATTIVSGGADVVSDIIGWKNDEAHKYYRFSGDILHNATLRALEKMNILVKEDKQISPSKFRKGTTHNYHLIATSNDKFRIHIYSIEKDVSEVVVRVNIFGNKPYAHLLYQNIDNELNFVEFK